MAAAVETHIYDQPVALAFGQKAAVKFGVAVRSHVGNMQVAQPASAGCMDAAPVAIHPGAVARLDVAVQGLDNCVARGRRFVG